jgi:hypothetical protein
LLEMMMVEQIRDGGLRSPAGPLRSLLPSQVLGFLYHRVCNFSIASAAHLQHEQ